MMAFRERLGTSGVQCKLSAEVPTLSLPNWIGALTGMSPTVHGVLGNYPVGRLPSLQPSCPPSNPHAHPPP